MIVSLGRLFLLFGIPKSADAGGSALISHQGIRAVRGQYRDVNGTRVVRNTEPAVLGSVLGIVELDFGGQGARDQDERELGGQVIQFLAPPLHGDHSDKGERAHRPRHLHMFKEVGRWFLFRVK